MDSLIIAIITDIKKAFGNVRFFPALCRLLYNYRGAAPGPGELAWGWGGVGGREGKEGRGLGFARRQAAALSWSLRAGALLRPLPASQLLAKAGLTIKWGDQD